jgi:hypothetical protein
MLVANACFLAQPGRRVGSFSTVVRAERDYGLRIDPDPRSARANAEAGNEMVMVDHCVLLGIVASTFYEQFEPLLTLAQSE